MKKIWLICTLPLMGLVVLAACEPVLGESESRATEKAIGTARVETAVSAGTQVGTVAALQATVDSAPILATQLSQLEREKARLQDTVHAVTTLGMAVLPSPSPDNADTARSSMRQHYQELQTSLGVEATTGCGLPKRGRFGVNSGRIYFNMIGVDIPAGTTHAVRWYRENELRYEASGWTADRIYPEICIYFWLEPSYTPFEPGMWSVELVANGESISPVPFEICDEGSLC